LNFKKIEIYGFKSFADKLVLDFNDGITCIVGPNGCGKSNIADAIRWVLGEQSARILRGKNMSDVIFDGTKTRRSLSYCEVSMYFDNTQRTYPVDYDELVISRRLYRSGESEYCINNEKVRLRDVVDLFRDTGIGREGYSIIGQGKIADILSAKPDERRQIFEEAAGISKFKAKKIQAERKLDQTRENMYRIHDRITVLEEDLGPLEKEAEDAKKARELKQELKIQEVNTYLYLRENNSQRKKEIYEQMDELNQKIDSNQAKLAATNLNYEKVVEELNNIDNKYKDLYEKRVQLSVKHQRVKGEHMASIDKLEQLKKSEIEMDMEISQKENKLDENKYLLQKKKEEKEEKLRELIAVKKEDSKLNEEYEKALQEFNDKARELEELNKYILSSSDEKGEIKAGLATLNAQIEALIESIAADKEELALAQEALNDTLKKKAFFDQEKDTVEEERKQKADKKDEIDQKIGELSTLIDQAQNQQYEIRQKVSELKTKAQMLEDYKKNYAGFAYAVKKLASEKSPDIADRIQGIVGEVLSVSPNLQTAIEIALGRSIQYIVTNDENDTSYLINYLKRNDCGRATFLALNRILPRKLRPEFRGVLEEAGCVGIASDLIKYDRKFRNIFQFLLGSVVIVEDMETGNRLSKKYNSAFRIVTLDGEDFAIGGATTGGSKPKADTSILSRDAVLNDTYKEIKVLANKHEVVTAEIDQYKEDLKTLKDNSQVLNSQLIKTERELSLITERCLNVDSEARKLSLAVKKLEDGIENKRDVLKTKKELLKAESSKATEAESQKITADELLAKLRQEYEHKQKNISSFNKRLTEMKLKLNSVEHSINVLEREINSISSEIKSLTDGIADLKSRKCTNTAMIEALTKQLKTLELSEEEQKELDEIERKINEIDDYKLKLKQRQEKLRKEDSELNNLIYSLNIQKNNLENLLGNIDADTLQLEQKIAEDYELDYNSCIPLRVENFDKDQAISRIRKIKRQLASLGEINEKAVEQFAEKSQEYQELSTHYKDICDAEQSLVDTINDLTAKMEKNFIESFEKIKENFHTIFKEIFDGGTGKLELDMSEGQSVLDAGIEIFAEPPGKQLKNISLLSGGERALTAIAILFAIIKLKPMPFCVLDEIEAALDDANAYLFAQYLRKFSKETQFVVITHRKPTMELADSLYGVTMQEKGVSKIVSVKLSTALKNVS
jgi:chromosome segregation protein